MSEKKTTNLKKLLSLPILVVIFAALYFVDQVFGGYHLAETYWEFEVALQTRDSKVLREENRVTRELFSLENPVQRAAYGILEDIHGEEYFKARQKSKNGMLHAYPATLGLSNTLQQLEEVDVNIKNSRSEVIEEESVFRSISRQASQLQKDYRRTFGLPIRGVSDSAQTIELYAEGIMHGLPVLAGVPDNISEVDTLIAELEDYASENGQTTDLSYIENDVSPFLLDELRARAVLVNAQLARATKRLQEATELKSKFESSIHSLKLEAERRAYEFALSLGAPEVEDHTRVAYEAASSALKKVFREPLPPLPS